VLRQINAEEALYVCNNGNCPYPVGLSDQLVQNPVPELKPNADQPKENGKLMLDRSLFCSSVNFYIVSVGVAAKEQLESAAPVLVTDDYEVDFLLDPELDAVMQEL
jgi:hypothetical protein